MSSIVKSNELGPKIAAIMGLPLEHMADMQIHLSAGAAVEVRCKFYIGKDEAGQIMETMKHYRVFEIDP